MTFKVIIQLRDMKKVIVIDLAYDGFSVCSKFSDTPQPQVSIWEKESENFFEI
jgi:hypothetical protein